MTKDDLRFFLCLPWTVQVERLRGRENEPNYFAATIAELPGFVATGVTDAELEQNFWEALECHLSSYLDSGEAPPIPDEVREAISTLEHDTPTVTVEPDPPFAGEPWRQRRTLERLAVA